MKKWLHKLVLRFIINEHDKWLKNHRKGIRLSFHKQDLRLCDLRETVLAEADFTDSCLISAKFSNASMENAIFTNTQFSGSVLKAGNIRNRQKEDMIKLFNEIHKIDNDATRIHLRNLMKRLEIQDPHERIR